MRVTVGQEVFSETVHDETVLLELRSGQYYGLDSISSRFWQLLSELESTEAVVDAALKEYAVEREKLTRDIEEFVRALEERGLVVTSC